jgi:hypothetical protein
MKIKAADQSVGQRVTRDVIDIIELPPNRGINRYLKRRPRR